MEETVRSLHLGAILLLIILVPIATAQPATPSTAPDWSVSIQSRDVIVAISLQMEQNLTSLRGGFTLPVFHVTAQGNNASDTTGKIQDALQAKSPHAQVKNLKVEAQSSPWSNSTNIQSLNISITFKLDGVSTSSNGVDQFDLSWRSFAVASNLTLNGFEINNIGSAYLLSSAQSVAAQPSSPSSHFSYQVNGSPVGSAAFPAAVSRFASLDFTRLAIPLTNWHLSYTPLSASQSLSLNVQSNPQGVLVVRFISAEGTQSTASYGLLYDLRGTITIPNRSTIKSDSINVMTSELPETLMGLAIVSILAIGGVSVVYERRTMARTGRKKSGVRTGKG